MLFKIFDFIRLIRIHTTCMCGEVVHDFSFFTYAHRKPETRTHNIGVEAHDFMMTLSGQLTKLFEHTVVF